MELTVCAGIIWLSLYCPLGIRALGTNAKGDTLATAIVLSSKLFFVCHPGVSYFLPGLFDAGSPNITNTTY